MIGSEHYREAERLLAEAAAEGAEGTYFVRPESLAAAQVHATLALAAATPDQHDCEAEPSIAFVYRAARGPLTLGTYTTHYPAREHCEADAINTKPDLDGGIFDWLGDESAPDDPYELLVTAHGVEQITDYTVTRITVDTEYDSEADA